MKKEQKTSLRGEPLARRGNLSKFLVGILVLAVFCFGAWKYNSKSEVVNKSDKPTIKIGVIIPQSGNLAEFGNNNKAAMEIAFEEYKGNNINFEISYEDDMFNSSKASSIANKMIHLDKVNAIISWSGTSGGVVSPITTRNDIFHIGVTNNKDIADGKNNFISSFSSESQSEKLLEVIKKNNAKSVMMFVVYQSGFQYTADISEKLLKDNGIIVERVNFQDSLKDFNIMIEKEKNKSFDMWFVAATPPALDIFLQAVKDKSISTPLTSIDSFVFSKRKDLLEGVEFVGSSDGNKHLQDQIKQKTGSENTFSTGFSYDAMKIMIKLYDDFYMKNNRLPTTQELSEALHNLKDFEGAVGKITVTKTGIIDSPAIMKKIINGKITEI